MRTAIIRYTPRAVGLKPSAMEREARLRGLERNNYSKTVSPPVQSPCDRRHSPAGASTSSARASACTIRSNPTTDIAAPQGLPRAQRGLMEIENYSSSQIRRPLSGSAVSCETPRFRQSVDRNSFRSPCRERVSGSVQPCPIGSTSMGTAKEAIVSHKSGIVSTTKTSAREARMGGGLPSYAGIIQRRVDRT